MSTQGNKSSYRTYEEWKLRFAVRRLEFLLVLTVPMRNGNSRYDIQRNSLSLVLTVPMRNGNGWKRIETGFLTLRSYRTYEEWKHGAIVNVRHIIKSSYRTYEEWKPVRIHINNTVNIVLTVPMRNGNLFGANVNLAGYISFLPYLWGMETRLWE